jgi:hypothetical protein
MPIAPITDLGTAIVTGIAAAFAAFFAALPSVLGALALLVIGWIVAGWIGDLLARGLRVVRFGELADRSGVTTFLERADIKADPAVLLGAIVKWYVRLVFVLLAANAVGLTAVATVVNDILAFIPNLLVAMFILAAFAWLANLSRGVVRSAVTGTGVPNAEAISTIVYATVFAFGVVAAADQLGVAANLINILFAGVVAALALAFGLAFGLGGREEAAHIWRDWRGHAASAIERAAAAPPARTPDQIPMPSGNGSAEERRRRDDILRRS